MHALMVERARTTRKMHTAVIYVRTMYKEGAPILKGVAFSALYMTFGLLACPFALGVLCYIGWKTGTDPTFHWTKLKFMGRCPENVDKIKCNILQLIESVKRLESDLCETEEEDTSEEVDSSVASSPSDVGMFRRETTAESEVRIPQSSITDSFVERDKWFQPLDSDSLKKTM